MIDKDPLDQVWINVGYLLQLLEAGEQACSQLIRVSLLCQVDLTLPQSELSFMSRLSISTLVLSTILPSLKLEATSVTA